MRYSAQWLAVILIALPASAIGMVTAMFNAKRGGFLKYNFGFDDPNMKWAWASVLRRPLSKHAWKNILPTWLEVSQERPSKAGSFVIVVLSIIAITGWLS